MDNNKKNNMHIAEENNNNNLIYGGIGIVVILLLFFGAWWYFSDSKKEDKQNTEQQNNNKNELKIVVSNARTLVGKERNFMTEEWVKAIKDYNEADTNTKEAKKKALEDYVKTPGAQKIKENYTDKEEVIEKAQQEIKSLLAYQDICDEEEKLTKVEKDLAKPAKGNVNQAAKKAVESASQSLKDAKKAKTNEDRNTALEKGIEALKPCVEAVGSTKTLLQDGSEEFKAIKGVKESLEKITENIPNNKEAVVEFSAEALSKALKAWDSHQENWNKYQVAKAIQ